MCLHQVPVILDLCGGKGPLATSSVVEFTVSSYNISYSPSSPNIFSIKSLTTEHSAATHTAFTTVLDLSKSTLSSGILSTTDGNAASPSSPGHVLLLLLSQHEKSKSLWAGPLSLQASLMHQNIQLFWIAPLPLHEAYVTLHHFWWTTNIFSSRIQFHNHLKGVHNMFDLLLRQQKQCKSSFLIKPSERSIPTVVSEETALHRGVNSLHYCL